MSSAFHKADSSRGLTLVEILVAVSVATLIVTVALSLYFTFSASFRRLASPRRQEAASAMDEIRRDLSCCVQAVFSNIPAFEVACSESGGRTPSLSTLAFRMAEHLPGNEETAPLAIHQRRYALVDSGKASVLFRESVCLWGPDAMSPSTSNAILKDITRFDVQVLDGGQWTNRWSSAGGRMFPRAARVTMAWRETQATGSASMLVFIPAGNSIPPPRRQTPDRRPSSSPGAAR